jgi:hypothetical protein
VARAVAATAVTVAPALAMVAMAARSQKAVSGLGPRRSEAAWVGASVVA